MRILTKNFKSFGRNNFKTGINFNFVDLGGGFGIKYKSSEKKIKLKKYSQSVEKFKKKFNCKIIFEPGRAIVGNTGILVTRVQYLKKGRTRYLQY